MDSWTHSITANNVPHRKRFPKLFLPPCWHFFTAVIICKREFIFTWYDTHRRARGTKQKIILTRKIKELIKEGKLILRLILTQQHWCVDYWPANSQAVGSQDLLFLQLCSQHYPLQPHLKAHPTLQHSVGEPATRPQWGVSIPEARLPTWRARTHFKVEVSVICAKRQKWRI